MKVVDEIINEIDKLKPMPVVTHKIMAIAGDPKSSMSEMSEIIAYDQGLTANLLKLCNSAYYGMPREIDSVHQAMVLMGLEQVVDIVLMSNSPEDLKNSHKGYDLAEGELWRASVSSALIARELAEKKGLSNNHLIFTAALIKDIGKVILGQYVADTFEEINHLVSEKEYSFREAEKEVIGIDHAELGSMVAEKWEFSSRMVEIIKNHHMPEESKETKLDTSIVYMADTLCMMMGIGVGSDGLAYRFHNEIVKSLGFNERDFQKVIAGFGEKLKKVEELLEIK